MGSPSSTWQKELGGVRGSRDARRRRTGSQRGIPPLAIEPTPDPIRTVLKGGKSGLIQGAIASPPGPISDYSSHSCWFKTLICSFCSAMLRPMSSVMFTALYDVMRAALYMQHLVWFDACFLHGFPPETTGGFKKKNRLYANMPRAIFTRL